MKTFYTSALLSAAALTTALPGKPPKGYPYHGGKLPPVKQAALEASIKKSALSAKAQELEDLAYSTPNRNRVMSSEGYNLTIDWITGYLDELSDYYTYEVQPFIALYSRSEGTLEVDGEDQEAEAFEYSPGGNVEADIVAVDNLGCEASDYPDAVADQIALISRGECEFGLKSALAGAAGAAAAIIYNEDPGPIGGGTLGEPPRPEGDYVITVGISGRRGNAILDSLNAGDTVTGVIEAESDIRNVTTYNVIAQTLGGDQDNVVMLGAHADSVFDGPGINDDGSGTIGILETAIQLSKYSTNNAVRFGWWGGEEFGLLGSTYYVETLNQTARAFDKLKLYLNFDMIASPNYIYAIYDGDGNAYNITGPPGSAAVEHFWEDWFASNGLNSTPTAFDGRSDYQAFVDNGIASGGLFTGAEELKTARQVAQFGGVEGEQLDQNYHEAGDNYDNLNFEAFITMTRALAASVAEYSTSLADIPAADDMARLKAKRDAARRNGDWRLKRKGHIKLWKA